MDLTTYEPLIKTENAARKYLLGFWSYAKERILKYHGASPERFPFYLKELELRYNHGKEDLFPSITKCLCNLVPKRD